MFRGTEKAFKLLMENRNRPVLYIADPDVDGLFSALLVCRFLTAYGIEYSLYINDDRKHGLLLDIEDLEGYMVIGADFATKPEQIEEIKKRDIVYINIDHHDIKSETLVEWDKGVIINNQYPFELDEKRYLSGAGVVFETLCEWDARFKSHEHFAIVGITLLSDIRPIENKQARRYLDFTYSISEDNEYFNYLISNTMKENYEKYTFGYPRMDRNYIDYSFSPRINSMLRYNESYEALEFIFGSGLDTKDRRVMQREFVAYLVDCATIVKNTYSNIAVIDWDDLDEFMLEQFDNPEPSNFIGYACSQIMGTGNSTLILLVKDGEIIRGSFRGRYSDIDYLNLLRSLDIKAEGHKYACGILSIDIDDEKIEDINRGIKYLERGHVETRRIIEVSNLSMFYSSRCGRIADNNNYVRDSYRTFIKYIGNNYFKRKDGDSYIEYEVDGYEVKCFDPELTPNNGYIVPITEKGYVKMYLREN